MSEQDYAAWAADLRNKYGIASPVAPETADDNLDE